MSRSHKKHNIRGNTSAESEKEDKQEWHRAFRRRNNVIMGCEDKDDIPFPHIKEHSDPWAMAKDGKSCCDDKKWMRK